MLKLDLWKLLLLDFKSIASDILQYIFEPAEWIWYIAIYFNLPSEYDTWPADKPPIYLQKSFISTRYRQNFIPIAYKLVPKSRDLYFTKQVLLQNILQMNPIKKKSFHHNSFLKILMKLKDVVAENLLKPSLLTVVHFKLNRVRSMLEFINFLEL